MIAGLDSRELEILVVLAIVGVDDGEAVVDVLAEVVAVVKIEADTVGVTVDVELLIIKAGASVSERSRATRKLPFSNSRN